MFNRIIESNIVDTLFKGKIIMIIGARQTGKTTLAESIIKKFPAKETRKFNGDNPADRARLNDRDFEFLDRLIGAADIIFIDEGQKIATIGQTLKLMVDAYKDKKQIIVTGSSSFNLVDRTEEPLTGRKRVYRLFPLSLEEIYGRKDLLMILKELEQGLVFGSYPEVAEAGTFDEKRRAILEISDSYLYKDVLAFSGIKKSDALVKLLKALALQIGAEVSYTELAGLSGLNKNTVESYVDILEKNQIVFRLPPYAGNKRKIISKLRKIYFHDTGVRNALIGNFNFSDGRADMGALWENYILAERLKFQSNHGIRANNYFWRTYDGAEIDLVEERDGRAFGYEFKWSRGRKAKKPPALWQAYPGSSYEVITPERIGEFVFLLK